MKRFRVVKTGALALAALVMACAIAACAPVPAKHALYLYLCGSTLETQNGAASQNLSELLEAEIPADTTVVVQTGGASTWRDHDIPADSLNRYEVKDGELRHLETLENASMGDAQTLEDFLVWSAQAHPAEQTMLVLWDHGGGADGTLCYDEAFGMDPLDPAELKSAFEGAGAHFNLIGLDACLMATLDTAQLLAPYGDYLVASQEIEPSGGWDYTTIVEAMDDPAAMAEVLEEAAIEKWANFDYGDFSSYDDGEGMLVVALPTEEEGEEGEASDTDAPAPEAEAPESAPEVEAPEPVAEPVAEVDDTLALAKVIADSYIWKSDEEAGGQGSMATLSVLDLSKMDEVEEAFDALSDELVAKGMSEDNVGFAAVREAATNSESFGGNSKAEGFSNLIDLSTFASYLGEAYDSEAANALTEVLADFVSYESLGGLRGTLGTAGGVSLYYPRYYDPEAIASYESWSSFPSYGTYLDAVYGDEPAETIGFADPGSLTADGTFRIQLTPESKRYLDNVAFELVRVEDDGTRTTLGRDFDFVNDRTTNTYESNFRGVWMALDGSPLAADLLGRGDDTLLYTAPVLVNGMPTNLRFNWRANPPYQEIDENGNPVESNEMNGRTVFMKEYYVVDGLWDALDEHELAPKDVTYLKEGDRVTPLPYAERYDAEALQGLDSASLETVTLDQYCGFVGEIPLEGHRFEYTFVVTDIFGNEHRSKTAVFEMDYEGDALTQAILDGLYPATIVEIKD